MSKPVSVTVIENGPLKVSADSVSLRFCGNALQVKPGEDVYLCRCGESTAMPYCDGAHARTGFQAEPADVQHKEIRVWEGRTIRTFFNADTCMHVFYCKPLKALRQAELDGDDAAAVEIARVVQSCPSGALTYEARDLVAFPPDGQADIDIIEGGEIRIQSAFQINTDTPERQPEDRATLCRCGKSKNKPWCDGRHKQRADFR